jgi:hypothetical protein
MASLIQLAAVGGQDASILVNPERTFFRGRYKRHTPFAIEPRVIPFDGGYGWGQTLTATIPRSGDLLTRLYLVVDLGRLDHDDTIVPVKTDPKDTTSPERNFTLVPKSSSNDFYIYNQQEQIKRYVDDIGKAMMEYITLEMGSVKYDTIWPEYHHAWEELCLPHEKQLGRLHLKSLGNVSKLIQWGCNDVRLYIPLEFWFHSGGYENALPLISMHLTDIKIKAKMSKREDLIVPVASDVEIGKFKFTQVTTKDIKTSEPDPSGTSLLGVSESKFDEKERAITAEDAKLHNVFLLGEFVFLDDAERELFARTKHEFLIHQVQRQVSYVPSGVTSTKVNLKFNHPTKELMVLNRSIANKEAKECFNFNGQCIGQWYQDAFESMSIMLNNNPRVDAMDPNYYSYVQPYTHHTRIPEKKVYVYSFATNPEKWQPTGSVNFSRIENAELQFEFGTKTKQPSEMLVFARSMNIVKVYAGIASLRWSS